MGVREDGLVVGSVSGGCVEGAVIEQARMTLATGEPRMLEFGELDDLNFWDVGLSCGGKIRVWVEPAYSEDLWREVRSRAHEQVPFVLLTRTDGGREHRLLDAPDADGLAVRAFKSGLSYEVDHWFVRSWPTQDRLIVVGAVHIALPLIAFAKQVGFEVVVIDPRESFLQEERFAMQPDRVVHAWPDAAFRELPLNSTTYAVVLTHDPKIDDLALRLLLRSPVRYIGALGSRTTQERRRQTLLGEGFTRDEVARIHGPVGLPIGALTPEEIAVSIVAELVQARRSS